MGLEGLCGKREALRFGRAGNIKPSAELGPGCCSGLNALAQVAVA